MLETKPNPRTQECQTLVLPAGFVYAESRAEVIQAYKDPEVSAICWPGSKRISRDVLEAVEKHFAKQTTFGDWPLSLIQKKSGEYAHSQAAVHPNTLKELLDSGFVEAAGIDAAKEFAKDTSRVPQLISELEKGMDVHTTLGSNWNRNAFPHADGKVTAAVTYYSAKEEAEGECIDGIQTGQHYTTLCYGPLDGPNSVGKRRNKGIRVDLNPGVVSFGGLEVGDLLIMKAGFVHETRTIPIDKIKGVDGRPTIQRMSMISSTN